VTLKKFILKGFLFFLVIIAIAYILDFMIQEGLKTSNYREITKWNEVIEGGIDAEILIVGSSRALVHFDCEQIKKSTGKTCYNLGFDGTTYPLQKLMLELYLSQNKVPEKIIWSLDYHSFSDVPDFYGFEQLVPYQKNFFIRKILSMHEIPDYQFTVPLFRYSYNPKMKVIGLYSYVGKYHRDPVLRFGFRMQEKVWDFTFEEFVRNNPDGFSTIFDRMIFEQFILFNKKLSEDSLIIWVVPPYFREYNSKILNGHEILSLFESSADQLNINFMDYSNHLLGRDKENFYNANHLNRRGVERFMDKWLEDIKFSR
jgi:hypothetical protein